MTFKVSEMWGNHILLYNGHLFSIYVFWLIWVTILSSNVLNRGHPGLSIDISHVWVATFSSKEDNYNLLYYHMCITFVLWRVLWQSICPLPDCKKLERRQILFHNMWIFSFLISKLLPRLLLPYTSNIVTEIPLSYIIIHIIINNNNIIKDNLNFTFLWQVRTGEFTMGRLDDAAKHKVVELRKAGLSFRKIKAVLELENIKVSAQAIYLFLREFQGRPPGRVRPVEPGSSTSPAQVQAQTGAVQQSWSNIQIRNLLRDSSQRLGFPAAADFAKQTPTSSEGSSSGETSGGNRKEQQPEEHKDENDIQIVSVTSLAQQSQQRAPQSTLPRSETCAMTSTPAVRRRVTPSPATSSMLAARKRILDKALSHRLKVPKH